MSNNTILELLKRCRRQWHKPDLHSFKAAIKDGVVFVEVDTDCVHIDAIRSFGLQEVRNHWRTEEDLNKAAEILEQLGLDLETVRM